jgi:DnaK suppressor protein
VGNEHSTIGDEARGALRERIDADRARALQRSEALARDFDDIVASSEQANVDDEHDPEGSTIAFERAQVAELLQATRVQIAELDAARERLDLPGFGRCEACASPIPLERLLARPTARHCTPCASP